MISMTHHFIPPYHSYFQSVKATIKLTMMENIQKIIPAPLPYIYGISTMQISTNAITKIINSIIANIK